MTPKQAAPALPPRPFMTVLAGAVRQVGRVLVLAGGIMVLPVQGVSMPWAGVQEAKAQVEAKTQAEGKALAQSTPEPGEQVLAGAVVPAAAEDELPDDEPWQSEVICPRDKIAPREYSRCLFDATRTSEQALEAALGRAMAAIAARSDLAPAQRAMWRRMLEEAQYRFVIFRNFDCQSVAPFEGIRGIGNFEQRSLCLISTNRARADGLEQRYTPGSSPFVASAAVPRREPVIREAATNEAATMAAPSNTTQPVVNAAPEGPEPRLGVWIYPTAPVMD